MYSNEFKEFVENCAKHNQFVGFGNPASKVVIIGKEVATDLESEEQNINEYNQNASYWQENIKQNKTQGEIKNWNPESKDNNPLYAWKGVIKKKTSDTWKKYQKLHDIVEIGFIDTDNSKDLTFLEDFFITEMNQNPSKKTADAQKKNDFKKSLEFRKKSIINHDFIKNFPVVILACSNYIIGKEIETIFDVRFDKEYGSSQNKFWTHFDNDRKRLVIHTRQLSGHVLNSMLEEMGNLVRHHLNK